MKAEKTSEVHSRVEEEEVEMSKDSGCRIKGKEGEELRNEKNNNTDFCPDERSPFLPAHNCSPRALMSVHGNRS